MSIDQYVNALVQKSQYGMKDYYLPSNEMLLKKVPFGKSDKEKNASFVAVVEKNKAWVPAPNKYPFKNDWAKIQT